jgi:hypothetical protein
MPMSPFASKSVMEMFGPELAVTPKPCYGFNIIDVNEENIEAFMATESEFGAVLDPEKTRTFGVEMHHTSMRKYGNGRVRVMVINRYAKEFDLDTFLDIFDRNPKYVEVWNKVTSLIEDYKWFTTEELDQNTEMVQKHKDWTHELK